MRIILATLAIIQGGENVSRHETLCLSQAVYFEARDQDVKTQIAIASFVYQFAQRNDTTVCHEIYKSRGIRYPWSKKNTLPDTDHPVEHDAWQRAVLLSALTLNGAIRYDIGDATHFLMPHIITRFPNWYDSELVVSKVGVVEFLRLEDYK